MTDSPAAPKLPVKASRPALFGAFFLIYFVWGANFLAIHYAVETIPPLLLMGTRSLLAGLCLYGWARLQSAGAPTRAEWLAAARVGLLLFLGCHGLLAWAELRISTGVAALCLATIPLWMTLLDWLWAGASRPRATVWLGIGFGLAGLAVLAGPSEYTARVDALGLAALLASAFAWSAGSILSRRSRLPSSVVLSTGMQLICGGLALCLASVLTRELASFDAAAVSQRSLIAAAYMVVAASMLTFTAYVWLLRVASPSRVASYAFVNPLVAVLLGWLVAGEPLAASIIVAALLIVAGVATIVVGKMR